MKTILIVEDNTDIHNYIKEVLEKEKYKVVDSYSGTEALMVLENKKSGDVYNLLDTGANYVWTGTEWDKLSETIDLSIYLKSTDAESKYAKITDLDDLIARVEILENGGTE